MASQDQAVDIPFAGGMAEGDAPFVMNGPTVELAEDCTVLKNGSYTRLSGGSALPVVSGPTGGSRGLLDFDGALVQHTTSAPYQYNSTAGTWRSSNTAGFVPTQVRSDLAVAPSSASVCNTAMAITAAGYEMYVWDEEANSISSGWVRKAYSIKDPLGGWLVESATAAYADGYGHQVIAVGNYFLLATSTAAGFQVQSILQTGVGGMSRIVGNKPGASTTWVGSASSVRDCVLSTDGTKAYFLVMYGTGANKSLIYTVSSSAMVGTAAEGPLTSRHSGCIAVDNAKVYMVYGLATDNDVLVTKFPESTISTGITGTNVGFVTMASTAGRLHRLRAVGGSNAGIYIAAEGYVNIPTTDLAAVSFWDPSVAFPLAPYIEVGFLPTSDLVESYTATSLRAYAHGYVLGSGMRYEANRGPQFLAVYNGLVEKGATRIVGAATTYYISAGNTYDDGRWSQLGTSGPYKGGLWLEIVSEPVTTDQGTSTYLVPRSLGRVAWDSAVSAHRKYDTIGLTWQEYWEFVCFYRGGLSRAPGGVFALTATLDSETDCLRRCSVDTSPSPPRTELYSGDSLFDGGCGHLWDGAHSYESTPHFGPIVGWVPAVALLGDVSQVPNPGTPTSYDICDVGYLDSWSFYWEWVDAKGLLHRSATSSFDIKLTLNKSNHYARYISGYFAVLPPLTAARAREKRNLRLVVSVLPGDGSTSSSNITKWSYDWSATTGEFTSMIRPGTGALSTTSGYIYTDGGVLGSESPPSPASLASTQDRVWLLSSDDRRTLYYSKPAEGGVAPEFNANLTVNIPTLVGEGVAVVAIDDKPIVLCERGLYVITGSGPNALGEQGEFNAQLIQSDTGCTNKNSVVSCDYGVLFQGALGIYLLDRGLNVTFVGSGVLDRGGDAISSSMAFPAEQQVRFGMKDSASVLVYNYALKLWTTLNKTAYDAVLHRGYYTRVNAPASFAIAQTDGSVDSDPESAVIMRIRTGWVKADKTQGFARFKRLQLLYSQEAAYTQAYGPLTVATYFNYEYPSVDGSNVYYETSAWSSSDRLPALRRSQTDMRIGRQKSESVKFDIQASNTLVVGEVTTLFPPVSLEGLTLTVGTITNTQFRHLQAKNKA